LLVVAAVIAPYPCCAQQPVADAGSQTLLIMPFENAGNATGAEWIGESFPEVVGNRLNSNSIFVVNRSDRLLAFDRLGLPAAAKPSRATTYQVAQELDADYVLMGEYRVDATKLSIRAQVMDLSRLRLSPEMTESGPLNNLIGLQTALAWDVLDTLKLTNGAGKEQFVAMFPSIRVGALENYIRGVLATSDQEKVRRFKEALLLDPGYTLAMLQLGKTYYGARDYGSAIEWLSKIPPSDASGNEGQFYLGLAAFYAGQMDRAAAAFRALASRLPLTEVFNNLGVASARLGDRRARAYFERSAQIDPNDPDYHFNLAVELYRQGQSQEAARELHALLALHPDAEARSFLDAINSGNPAAVKLPLQRIKRNYDESSFRQLAFEIENLNEERLRKADTASRVAFYVQHGRELLDQGLAGEAGKQFQKALALDPMQAAAHAGLARVLELSLDKAGARREALASLRLASSAEAYLVLARLDLADNNPGAAQQNVERALALDPANAAAVALKHDIAAGSVGKSGPP
jgi:tetratricopeptide (TPR) repeat protein